MHSLWANSARSLASSLACLLPAACCLLTAGCNNSGRQMQTDLYQRELRLQEDEIYRLEDYIEEYQGIVRGYRCKVEDLEREIVERRETLSTKAASPAPEPLPTPAPARPSPTRPSPARPDPPAAIDLDGMPEIETPDMLSPPAEAAPAFEAPADAGEPPLFNGANASPIDAGSDSLATTADVIASEAVAKPIATVALVEEEPTPPNPYPTATPQPYLPPAANTDPAIRLDLDTGDAPGTFDALIATAPGRSATAFDGQASVMLTDPTLDGRQRRLARWDFSTAEVVESTNADGSGLRLAVALPSDVPEGRPLRVWIRLVDPSGKKRLQATDVRYLDGALQPIRHESRLMAAAEPTRLPPTDSPSVAEPPSNEAVAETLPSSGWRTARDGSTDRRLDTAVAPVSFEADW